VPTGPVVSASEPVPDIPVVPYPKFPAWVYTIPSTETGRRSSIYEGLVKPYCDVNSRYEEFILMPAYTVLLNYLGTKVLIQSKAYPLSFFMVSIGQKGKTIKSSSAESATEYFHLMGLLEQAGGHIKTADSKSLVWTAGSAEGLGLSIDRTKCKNAIVYYDELAKLDKKSQIECSALGTDLNTAYEAGKLQNTVKRAKECYSIEPGTYCASFIACTTEKNFNEQWSRMYTGNDGLDDRFFFLLQPEQLKEVTPSVAVNTLAGALETRRLIDKAVQQGKFDIDDDAKELLRRCIVDSGFSNRDEIRAEKLSLAFAVDMGLDHIDADCVDRGLAVCRYGIETKRWLSTMEARGPIAAAQQKIRRLLARRKDGKMLKTELERLMESDQWGTDAWYTIYQGSIRAGRIREELQDGRICVRLLVALQEAL
jgi:hypothetical protein